MEMIFSSNLSYVMVAILEQKKILVNAKQGDKNFYSSTGVFVNTTSSPNMK
jgi:hypothetical protein